VSAGSSLRCWCLDEDTAAVHDGSGWMVTGRGGALLSVGPQLRSLGHEDLPPLPASVLM
jgi:hypothetical protein